MANQASLRLLLFTLSTVLAGLLMTGGIVEISLRAVGFGHPTSLILIETYTDGSQRYIPNPDLAGRFIFRPPRKGISETGLMIHYDSFPLVKAPNEKRIVFLGDSTIFGMPDPVHLTIPAFLERILKAAYPEVKTEVFNCAMTSINSHTLWEMARELDLLQPDLVLVYTGHNEFYGPHGTGSTVRFIENGPARVLISAMSRTRCYQLLQRFALSSGAEVESGSMTLMAAMVGKDSIRVTDDEFRKTEETYRSNLKHIAQFFTGSQTKVGFCGLVANERDCAPLKPLLWSGTSDAYAQSLRALSIQALNLLCAGQTEDAEAVIEKIRGEDDKYGNMLFLQGRLAEKKGDFKSAEKYYREAMLQDGMRFRAPPSFNGIQQEVATELGACYIDLDCELRGHTPSGLLGGDLFVDHVHPNIHGKYLLANAIAREIEARNLLGLSSSPAAILDETSCLIQAGYTRIDSINSLNRMIGFQRCYPLNQIINKDEMINILESQKRAHESAFSPAYLSAIAHLSKPSPGENGNLSANLIHHDELAFRLYEDGAWKEASEEYYSLIQSCNKYFPGLPSYYLRLSECLKKRTEIPEAERNAVLVKMYSACKQIFMRCSNPKGPDRSRESFEMGVYAANSGDQPLARALLEESIKLDPQPRRIEILLQIEWKSGNRERAMNLAQELAGMEPNNPFALSIMEVNELIRSH